MSSTGFLVPGRKLSRRRAMTLTFKLRFHTKYGQSLWLTGDHEILGGLLSGVVGGSLAGGAAQGYSTGRAGVERAIPLQYLDEEFWQVTITLPKEPTPNLELHYNYVL